MAILDFKLTNKDVASILESMPNLNTESMITTISARRVGGMLSVTIAPQFLRLGSAEGTDVFLANLRYDKTENGAIQFVSQEPKQDIHKLKKTYEWLVDTIDKLGLSGRVLFYEFDFTIIREFVGAGSINSGLKLRTLNNPRNFGIRLYDGDMKSPNIMLSRWKQITIEPYVADARKSVINGVYRVPPEERLVVDDILYDIDSILKNFA